MKKVVSFSGGRTSAYLCHLMKEHYGDDVDFIFMDTGAEHPETYEFIKKVNAHFDLNITYLCAKITPWLGEGIGFNVLHECEIGHDLQLFSSVFEKYGTPYIGGAFCTDRLKTQPFKKFCDHVYGKGEYETWLGIRADEPKRLNPKKGFKYLADISDFEKIDVLRWWNKQPFDLEIDEHLGNCTFCIKKSINKVALAARDEPELYQRWDNLINSKLTRQPEARTTPPEIMYRGNNSIKSINDKFLSHERIDILATIKSMKQFDSNSCSESCEAIGFSDQLSLF